MSGCRTYKLSEVVSLFCAMQFNDHRRGYKNMLVMAGFAWDEIFTQTLWAVQGDWLELEAGNPYPVVTLPEGTRLLSVYQEVPCGPGVRLMPVLRSTTESTPAKKFKVCSCTKGCGCGSACSEANSFTYTETPVEIDGSTYIQRQWFEVSTTGDVFEWREMPSKLYRTVDTTGQWSSEFADDFTIQMEHYDIGTVKMQRRIATLEVKPCGCIAETAENKRILATQCGCVWDQNFATASEKAQAVRYRLHHNGKQLEILGGTPSHLYIKHQPRGASAQTEVPQFSVKALMDGMDYYSKVYNPLIKNPQVAQLALRAYNRSRMRMVEYLNPINWSAIQPDRRTEGVELSRVPAAPQKVAPVVPQPTTLATPLADQSTGAGVATFPYSLPFQF